jgi:hypothetical protein
MEPLVQWLLGGFVLSLLFIFIARWFWKRYDEPSEAAIEWQKEQEEKKKERKVWESVEMQMRREAEEAEKKAAFQIKRETVANSGKAPDAAVVAKAFESLGGAPEPAVTETLQDEKVADDSDLEAVPDLIEVRQDGWISEDRPELTDVAEPEEPDWELVERLKKIAESEDVDELPHPELPHAPTLPEIEDALD